MTILPPAREAPARLSNRSETSICHLAIMRGGDSEILISVDRGVGRLPTIEIPARQRAAPNLLPAIRNRFGLDTVCRFSVAGNRTGSGARCVVLDLRTPVVSLRGGGSWLPVEKIPWGELDLPTRNRLREAMARINAYATGELSANFVAPEWLEEVAAWMKGELSARSIELAGLSGQLNMGPDFALLRFDTSGQAVWFKAVGYPNLQEFDITALLAKCRLPHLPEILGMHQEWRGWLMYEANGTVPGEVEPFAPWISAARALAELQLASIPHISSLLAVGCIDLRASGLEDAIEPYLSETARLMEAQPREHPPRLTPGDLLVMERQLHRACHRLQTISLPETLGHSDFNVGNILSGVHDTVFLDWAQAHVGLPFLTLEYLLLAFVRATPGSVGEIPSIREEYLRPWRAICEGRCLLAALEVAPLLAVFAYALVCDQNTRHLPDLENQFAGYLRSLARRVRAEAGRLEETVEKDANRSNRNGFDF